MTKLSLAAAILAGALAVPSLAFAIEPYLPKSTKAFGKADANADGRLTAAEVEAKAERKLLRLDADKNGDVSAAEIDAALTKAMEKRRDHLLGVLDADKSGGISKSEIDAYVAKLVGGADSDGDGAVTLAEAKAFKPAKLKPGAGDVKN